MNKPIAIFVVGPTASGKTELAVNLARHFSSAVISADSMQIYKGMHIASAAPDEEEMKGVPHKMLEFLPYGESFTVADYVAAARNEINELLKSGKTPIIAGGTGLYINSLVDNICFLPVQTDFELRKQLEEEFDSLGGEAMLNRLADIDEAAAKRLHPSDRRRIIRAIEIFKTSGITKTEQDLMSKNEQAPFYPIIIGLTFSDRQTLYNRINLRVDKMMASGLLDEAKTAYRNGGGSGASQAIGHKELFGFLKGEQTLKEATESLKQATRRYAKRQLTWFNKDNRVNWIYRDKTPDVFKEALKIIESEVNGSA